MASDGLIKLKTDYRDRIKSINGQMTKKNKKIMIFEWICVVLLTIKCAVGIVYWNHYDFRLLGSILIVELIISLTFMYALCKINGIAKKHQIDLRNCYIMMHFFCIWILLLNWTADAIFFYKADKYNIHT